MQAPKFVLPRRPRIRSAALFAAVTLLPALEAGGLAARPHDSDFPAGHFTVQHNIGEYVRGGATVNACESYFSILKRGIGGVYQHVSPTHLKRYVGEFDFRYNNRIGLGVDDMARTATVARGMAGKRLTYQGTNKRPETPAQTIH